MWNKWPLESSLFSSSPKPLRKDEAFRVAFFGEAKQVLLLDSTRAHGSGSYSC